jgi:hypothetical protein
MMSGHEEAILIIIIIHFRMTGCKITKTRVYIGSRLEKVSIVINSLKTY